MATEYFPAAETVEFLRDLPLFAGLDDDGLERLARAAECRLVPAGATLIEEGADADGLYLIRSGELEVSRYERDRGVVLAVATRGNFIGEMALVDDTPRSATVKAVTESEVVVIAPADFRALLRADPDASLTILRTVLHRLRDTETSLHQHARLASLGTLAAGLAHELNNPASAIQRSADHLRKALPALESSMYRAGEAGLSAEISGLRRSAIGGSAGSDDSGPAPPSRSGYDPVARDREEEALIDWLDERGFEAAHAVDALLDAGWNQERLASLIEERSDRDARVLVELIASSCLSTTLVDEIARGAAGLLEIVGAVKVYTHHGDAPIGTVQVGESIANTLTVLRPRLGRGVEVVSDFEEDLPPIAASGGELSQLWTILIDNAIDAMDGAGRLEIRTFARDGHVVVRIVDDGPGIPPGVRHRIFDPFFTTKPQGEGSGLGLHIARNLVHKHRGSISVDSAPGRTVFEVELPVR